MTAPRTLYDKIWDDHVVSNRDDGTSLIFIDRHLIHEVTTPQAFSGLKTAGRRLRRPDLTLAVIDRLMQLGPYQFNPVRGEAAAFLWDRWQGPEDTRAWLRGLGPEAGSGDLYARLPSAAG